MYWTIKSVPELQALEPLQRKVAWRACYFDSFKHWQTWAAVAGGLVMSFLCGAVGLVIDGHGWIFFGGPRPATDTLHFPIATLGLTALSGMLGSLEVRQVCIHMMRPYLKRYVEEHNA